MLADMQSVMPSWFWPEPNYRYRPSGPNRRASGSLMELTIDVPCSCPSCGKCILRMQSSRRKMKFLGLMMMLNFFIYFLVEISRSYSQGKSDAAHPNIPHKHFWRKSKLSEAFWNRKQQHLDQIENPQMLYHSDSSNSSNTSHLELAQISHKWNYNSTGTAGHCEPDLEMATQIKDYNSLPQRFKDFLLYMRCRSYPMLTDAPGVCSEPTFLLFAVKSLAHHFDRRQAIRQSWGRAGVLGNHRVAAVFLLGNTAPIDHFPNISALVHHEAMLHGDLLQWDYRDTFFNLTLKEVLFLEWLGDRCPSARYVFKGDDDVFVNTHHILRYLDGLSGTKARDLFVGDVITKAGPHRDKKLKYYIPESVFVGQYPPYAGGGGYLYSGDVGLRLRNMSHHVLLYPIDDVYTGMCLQRLGLVPEKHKGFRTFDIEEKYRENACAYQSLMLVHPRNPQDVIKIWSWINDPKLNC
ncbi:N-acetyllactosaminide beta-1,3-N-acetylglucosaminyltransferase 2a isoform X1 [Electrophorus electricus]|uniref:Hexosyltransferase n=3 Tax=Electrophorus electricus TaxID=8005 RepID=A0A4W4GHX0_ELEEL|nr:N-acetyllactosaminide beta-1,3-N-acetylglucosaminyltransferase 2a isoform X1 [Electrophorus electricus]XP_026869561.2 N-acetyllactosaminide beta-1,3-N-acetylglucosaminyltransferase 2a isoform X1 [Electrophorus electricus]XP_026869562.2 N-acetyllactosaminide beta-1,3-N-acetylglucosaminyltransferase 2a isoform X1 [Electrophorus electricus]XP_026869565.2 N-acetyllactosaminide beta-1,3-N-acetylglucosaminyltransferase 2a isoform X1 [Electrophorus electricus]XP_035390933.1 N-acetyllactosaminide be